MKDLIGGPIPSSRLNQATASAVTACDADDGVTEGVLDDPRAWRSTKAAAAWTTPATITAAAIVETTRTVCNDVLVKYQRETARMPQRRPSPGTLAVTL